MIRKQVYIEPRHDRMLKRRASQRGVTEAELIREALDSVEIGALPGRRDVDAGAARKALAFMRSLSASHTEHPGAAPGRESRCMKSGSVEDRSPD